MVLGWQKVILLPDVSYSQKEIEHILSHELQHILNHDIWIKQLMNLLTIVYWWFLPVLLAEKSSSDRIGDACR